MALSLAQTKRRIASVNSTMKITKAMELVATVKSKRYKNFFDANELYARRINKAVDDLLKVTPNINSYLLNYNESEQNLIIVVTSSLGLCGSYNSNIFNFVYEHVSQKDELIVIGKRGYHKFKEFNQITSDFVDIFEGYNDGKLFELYSYVLTSFSSKKYRSVKIIYTNFINQLDVTPKMVELLPIRYREDIEFDPFHKNDIIIEPNKNEVLESLGSSLVYSNMYRFLLESLLAEQTARRNAMSNASDNAQDIVEELTLEYNKVRQGKITQDIIEIVGGANS